MRARCLAFALVAAACDVPAPAGQTWKGVLTWTDSAGKMSVDSYLGTEFTLTTEKGPIVLGPSAIVTRDALQAMNGKAVTVTCVPHPQAPPEPNSSFPMGPDGRPLPRPAICAVTALTSP